MRVTDSMIDAIIDRLNSNKKSNVLIVRKDAYGYSQVSVRYPNSTGESDLSLGNTKKELYYQLKLLEDWLGFNKRPELNIHKCTHKSDSNGESLVRELYGKNVCISCNKEIKK